VFACVSVYVYISGYICLCVGVLMLLLKGVLTTRGQCLMWPMLRKVNARTLSQAQSTLSDNTRNAVDLRLSGFPLVSLRLSLHGLSINQSF